MGLWARPQEPEWPWAAEVLLFSPGLGPWGRWIVGPRGASWGPQGAKGVHTMAKGTGSQQLTVICPQRTEYTGVN